MEIGKVNKNMFLSQVYYSTSVIFDKDLYKLTSTRVNRKLHGEN